MSILTVPNTILTTPTTPVIDFEFAISVIGEMKLLIEQNDLLGLAANQVGYLGSVFVFKNKSDKLLEAINPILKPNKEMGENWSLESCASIPNFSAVTNRWNEVNLTALNIHKEQYTLTLRGITARIAQHEYDHLRGILFSTRRLRETKGLKPVL